jgi:flagellar protein FliS
MTSSALRARYLGDSVSTASPGRLLVMLYERLVLDLDWAEGALRAGDRNTGSDRLLHAQDIVAELLSSLDLTAWSGAANLASLYTFLLAELISANVTANADKAASCLALVEPLLDAWRQAAAEVAGAEPAAQVA